MKKLLVLFLFTLIIFISLFLCSEVSLAAESSALNNKPNPVSQILAGFSAFWDKFFKSISLTANNTPVLMRLILDESKKQWQLLAEDTVSFVKTGKVKERPAIYSKTKTEETQNIDGKPDNGNQQQTTENVETNKVSQISQSPQWNFAPTPFINSDCQSYCQSKGMGWGCTDECEEYFFGSASEMHGMTVIHDNYQAKEAHECTYPIPEKTQILKCCCSYRSPEENIAQKTDTGNIPKDSGGFINKIADSLKNIIGIKSDTITPTVFPKESANENTTDYYPQSDTSQPISMSQIPVSPTATSSHNTNVENIVYPTDTSQTYSFQNIITAVPTIPGEKTVVPTDKSGIENVIASPTASGTAVTPTITSPKLSIMPTLTSIIKPTLLPTPTLVLTPIKDGILLSPGWNTAKTFSSGVTARGIVDKLKSSQSGCLAQGNIYLSYILNNRRYTYVAEYSSADLPIPQGTLVDIYYATGNICTIN